MTSPTLQPRSAIISVLVENEAGILARVIGLFTGRGYNIDSLTVAPVDPARNHSRINIVTSGTDMVIEQIKAQLDRLVQVYRIADLSTQGPHVARELALTKWSAKAPTASKPSASPKPSAPASSTPPWKAWCSK